MAIEPVFLDTPVIKEYPFLVIAYAGFEYWGNGTFMILEKRRSMIAWSGNVMVLITLGRNI
jgi:hypothetical protein